MSTDRSIVGWRMLPPPAMAADDHCRHRVWTSYGAKVAAGHPDRSTRESGG